MDIQKWFFDPIVNQYADFTGRATRQQYWMFHLCALVAYIVLLIVSYVTGLAVLPLAGMIAVVVPSIAMNTRRLHDINKTGWWQLLSVIPLVGPIVLLIWACTNGDAGPNQYGNPVMADVMPNMAPAMPADAPATPVVTDAEIVSSNEGKTM